MRGLVPAVKVFHKPSMLKARPAPQMNAGARSGSSHAQALHEQGISEEECLLKLRFQLCPARIELIDALAGLVEGFVGRDEFGGVRGDGRIFGSLLLAFQFGFGFENQLLHAVPLQPIKIRQSLLRLPSTGSLARGRHLFKFGSRLGALLCLPPLIVVGK